MAAGQSAETEADRARRAAQNLRRKADWAGRVADNFAKGAEGEQMVAAAVAGLEPLGWRFLHDRRHPEGGNVDHIAIGPPGVAILDAKRWTAPVTITPDRRLVSSKYDHSDMVEKLNQTIEMVRGVLSADGARVAVRGCIVLAGDADRARAVRDLGDVRVLGIDGLRSELQRARGDLDQGLIDALHETLAAAFPVALDDLPAPPTRHVDEAPQVPSALFEKAQRFYYLRPWKKAGHNRLYLRNDAGVTLGWADVNTGAISVECEGTDAKLAEVLLGAADPSGMQLAPGDLPKVATRLRGGRLLSRLAVLHTSVLVGQEWRAYGKHRLYGTLIDPAATSWTLGYVDLKTGESHPTSVGDLSSLRGPASRYLEYLRYKMPPAPAPRAKN